MWIDHHVICPLHAYMVNWVSKRISHSAQRWEVFMVCVELLKDSVFMMRKFWLVVTLHWLIKHHIKKWWHFCPHSNTCPWHHQSEPFPCQPPVMFNAIVGHRVVPELYLNCTYPLPSDIQLLSHKETHSVDVCDYIVTLLWYRKFIKFCSHGIQGLR